MKSFFHSFSLRKERRKFILLFLVTLDIHRMSQVFSTTTFLESEED